MIVSLKKKKIFQGLLYFQWIKIDLSSIEKKLLAFDMQKPETIVSRFFFYSNKFQFRMLQD